MWYAKGLLLFLHCDFSHDRKMVNKWGGHVSANSDLSCPHFCFHALVRGTSMLFNESSFGKPNIRSALSWLLSMAGRKIKFSKWTAFLTWPAFFSPAEALTAFHELLKEQIWNHKLLQPLQHPQGCSCCVSNANKDSISGSAPVTLCLLPFTTDNSLHINNWCIFTPQSSQTKSVWNIFSSLLSTRRWYQHFIFLSQFSPFLQLSALPKTRARYLLRCWNRTHTQLLRSSAVLPPWHAFLVKMSQKSEKIIN